MNIPFSLIFQWINFPNSNGDCRNKLRLWNDVLVLHIDLWQSRHIPPVWIGRQRCVGVSNSRRVIAGSESCELTTGRLQRLYEIIYAGPAAVTVSHTHGQSQGRRITSTQREGLWLTNRETEVPSEALNMVQRGYIKDKGQYSSPPSVSISLSLPHAYRSFDPKKE